MDTLEEPRLAARLTVDAVDLDGHADEPSSAPPITIHTLGHLSITIGGVPLSFARKTPKKPLELLTALIALGGKGVREERLAELIWPDADADLAAHALATALYRLRKLLGAHCIVRRDGVLALNPQQVHVDVWELEHCLTQLTQACRTKNIERIMVLTEGFLDTRPRPFLESENDAPWVLSLRDGLRHRLLRQMEFAARTLMEASCIDSAIACYQCALEMDPLIESIYRGLMRGYLIQQHRAEALRTYDRCRKALQLNLGVMPSFETQALAGQARAEVQHALA